MNLSTAMKQSRSFVEQSLKETAPRDCSQGAEVKAIYTCERVYQLYPNYPHGPRGCKAWSSPASFPCAIASAASLIGGAGRVSLASLNLADSMRMVSSGRGAATVATCP